MINYQKIVLLLEMKQMTARLDLKSTLYRESPRSPSPNTLSKRSKSPVFGDTIIPMNLMNQIDSIRNRTFQNICCPNCRYLFRAPKEQYIVTARNGQSVRKDKSKNKVQEEAPYFYDGRTRNPERERGNNRWAGHLSNRSPKTSNKKQSQPRFNNSKYKTALQSTQNKKTVQTQTDSAYTALKLTNKREKTLSEMQTDRTPSAKKSGNRLNLFNLSEKEPYYDSWQQQELKSDYEKGGEKTSREKDRQQNLVSFMNNKYKDSPAKKIVKTQFNTEEEQQQRNYPNKNIYLREKSLQQQPQKKGTKSPKKQQVLIQQRKQQPEIYKNSQTKNKIINNSEITNLMDKIYLSEQLMDILKFNMQLTADTMVPSYCKMLVYDLHERQLRGSRIKNQEEEHNTDQDGL